MKEVHSAIASQPNGIQLPNFRVAILQDVAIYSNTNYNVRMLPVVVTFTPDSYFGTIVVMGRAGKALKQTLETYKISQNRLAIALGVDRSKVFRWFHEQIDPTAETVAEIVTSLNTINSEAAETFITLYLGELVGEYLLPQNTIEDRED